MNRDERAGTDGTVGRRIVVFGPSGSGKTTAARRLASALGLDHVELDSLFHRAGWEPTPDDEFRAIVAGRLAGATDGWVVDGNYTRVREVVLPQVDTVIWLRLPFRVVFPRLWRRTVVRIWHREELWNGNRESFRTSFLSRDSILLWGVSNWRPHIRKTEEALRGCPEGAAVLVLRTPAAVEALLGSLEGGSVVHA